MSEFRRIVTIFEQYGAGGAAVAEGVSRELGVPFLHQAVSSEQLEQAEREARGGEGAFDRFLRSFSPMPEPDADITWSFGDDDATLVFDNNAQVQEAIAGGGGVLVGRNATVILADVPGTLHVKLIGSVDSRVERAMREGSLDAETARTRQAREDRVRAEMSQRLYQWDPTSDEHYDLVVDTGTFSVDQAVDLIVHAHRLKYPD